MIKPNLLYSIGLSGFFVAVPVNQGCQPPLGERRAVVFTLVISLQCRGHCLLFFFAIYHLAISGCVPLSLQAAETTEEMICFVENLPGVRGLVEKQLLLWIGETFSVPTKRS